MSVCMVLIQANKQWPCHTVVAPGVPALALHFGRQRRVAGVEGVGAGLVKESRGATRLWPAAKQPVCHSQRESWPPQLSRRVARCTEGQTAGPTAANSPRAPPDSCPHLFDARQRERLVLEIGQHLAVLLNLLSRLLPELAELFAKRELRMELLLQRPAAASDGAILRVARSKRAARRT